MSASRLSDEKGMALITVVAFTAVLYVSMTSYFMLVQSNMKMVRSVENKAKAWALADAGLEEAAWQINYRSAAFAAEDGWSGSSEKTKTVAAFSDHSGAVLGGYTITVAGWSGVTPTVTVVSGLTGAAGSGTSATVKAQFRSVALFSKAVQSLNAITMSGNAYTDSYDSSVGAYGGANVNDEGDIATNAGSSGAVTLSGNATVNGDAATGPGGTVTTIGNAEVTGDTSADADNTFDDPVVPSSLTGLASSVSITTTRTLNGGSYKYPSISLSGNNVLTINGDVEIYLTGSGASSLSTSGNGRIVINSGSTLKIYADRNISISGNGIVNNNNTQGASTLQIYGTSTAASVSISGNGALIGVVNAPSAAVTVSGNGGVYGSVIARQFTMSGNGGIHYDEALAESGLSSGSRLKWYRKI